MEERAYAKSDPPRHVTTYTGQTPSLSPGKGRDAMGRVRGYGWTVYGWTVHTEFPKTPLGMRKPPLLVLRDWLVGAPYEGLP